MVVVVCGGGGGGGVGLVVLWCWCGGVSGESMVGVCGWRCVVLVANSGGGLQW